MTDEAVTILVVDDDEFTAEMTGMILEGGGFSVKITLGGSEALEELDSNPIFAAVVSDHNMPQVTGEDLYALMQARNCGMPFVLLTGRDADELRARNPQMDCVLAKDENLADELCAVVERVLAARRTEI